MKVTLLSFTPDALTLLLATKQTRLALSPGLLDEVRGWPIQKKIEELEYMRGTIQSSWEFVDYTFLIEGVTRAFTHQLVRTRAGSYAQQSQRTVDMSGFDYVTTGACKADDTVGDLYALAMREINDRYQEMVDLGAPPQDARGILPTNVCTNIVAKFSLRTLADMAKVRLCTRTQGEYQNVFRAMRNEVILVHAWAEPFIRVACAATGVCCFPNNTECPIKGATFNPDTGLRWDECTWADGTPLYPATRNQIQEEWEKTRFEATPKEAK